MSSLQVNLPTGIVKSLLDGEKANEGQQPTANQQPTKCTTTMKNMISEFQGSTQLTHQEGGHFTMSTPKADNFDMLAFDLTPTGNSRKYFEEIKDQDGSINIIPVNAKRPNSSISEDPASQRKLKEPSRTQDLLVQMPTIKSKSTGLLKSFSSKMEHSHGELQPSRDENKPTSLSLLSLKNCPQPKRSKKMTGWLIKNHLERASETDSMHVSTNVIKIQESKDMMGIGLDNEVSEEGSPVPLDSHQKKTEQKRNTKCPMPKSLEGSNRDIILPEQIECEEEAEDPMSESDQEEEEQHDVGQEEMQHSIPDSFDE